jgi:hypothetical protein
VLSAKNFDAGTSPVLEYKDKCRIADAGCDADARSLNYGTVVNGAKFCLVKKIDGVI